MAASSLTPKPSTRFHISTPLEVREVRESRVEDKTLKQTAWGVSVFTAWLEAREKSRQFEVLPPSAIDELLGTFYVEARQVNGAPYSKSALRCIRAAIQQHLNSEPWIVRFF